MKLALFCILLTVAFVSASSQSRVILEDDVQLRLPAGYKFVRSATSQDTVYLLLALKPRNLDILTAELDSISNPLSPKYGQHWTIDQVNALVKPSKKAFSTVLNWLSSHGIKDIRPAGASDHLKVFAPANLIERLVQVKLSVFEHEATGKQYIRSLDKYSVPAEVAEYLMVISGIIRLPHTEHHKMSIQGMAAGRDVTPQTIRKLYNIPEPSHPHPDNVQAVVSFLEQYFAPSDLSLFQSWANLTQIPISKVVGFNIDTPEASGVEASLDVDYLTGIPEYIPTWVWSTNGTIENGNEPWHVFLDDVADALASKPLNFPSVFSISYQDLEFTISVNYAEMINIQFQKLTMTGITFVTGSGDWGVGCQANQGAQCDFFTADFPSSSPYVTSLGGTYVNSNGVEVNIYFSSGGFSNYFKRPGWQDDVILPYLMTPSVQALDGWFDKTGRAFPDLSTVSTNFQVFQNGRRIPVGGTSAATPTFAAMVSMLNDARLKAGMSTMGWINPFLYAAKRADAAAFTDITSGDAQMAGCCGKAFSAIPGYDAVTGLGSPMYDRLLKLALNPSMFKANN